MVVRGSQLDPVGKVSIIIPVHDTVKLNKCLEAIHRQTYKNIEVVRVTSGGFPAEKRNHGFKLSKGDYVLFLDEDEYLSSSAVEQCLKKVVEGFDIVSVPVVKMPVRSYLANCVSLLRENTYKTMFFRRSVFEKHGLFNPDFVLCDDLEMLERIREKSVPVGVIQRAYMLHEENDSVKDIFMKTLLARKSFRLLRKRYGRSVFGSIVSASRHRRRIFREILRKPSLFPGVLMIMGFRFLSRRIP